jgi:hypothetical protein
LASTITLEAHARTAIRRCCPAHPDWKTLARHLLADFADVPTQEIFEGLRQAKHAGEFFDLAAADALDCAELMVRYHILDLHPPDDHLASSGCPARLRGGIRARGDGGVVKQCEEVADGALAQESLGEGGFGAYVVAVAPSVAFLHDVAGVDQVLDDTEGSALRHLERGGDFT